MSDFMSDADLNGETLADRYRILGELGRGGMGVVYQGFDVRLERLVVVKVPAHRILSEAAAKKRFLLEIEELRRIEHANVVWVLDCGEHRGVPYFVLQYLGGGNLAERIEERPDRRLSVDEVLPWLGIVAETLDHLHAQQGIVHRDVKPANILFDGQGTVFLSDFGLVKSMAGTSKATELTGTGMMPGSPAYMAPEQALGDAADGAADQYALAVTLYESLSGRLPFDGDTPLEVILAKRKGGAVPLHKIAPGLPRGAGEAVMRGLHHDPRNRFATCLELHDAFVAAVQTARSVGDETERIELPANRIRARRARFARRRRRRRLTEAAVTCALVALFVGIVAGYVRAVRERLDAPPAEPPIAAGGGEADPGERPVADGGVGADPDGSRLEPRRTGPVPRIRLELPRDGEVMHPAAIEVRGVVDNVRSGGSLVIGGVPVSCRGGVIDWVVPPLDLPDGSVDVQVVYLYRFGEAEETLSCETVCTVVIDRTPPELTVEPPLAQGKARVVVTGRAADAHLVDVFVNGERAAIRGDGRFWAELPGDAPRPLPVTVVARDRAGNRTLEIAEVR